MLSLDLGATTGWAFVTEQSRHIYHGEYSLTGGRKSISTGNKLSCFEDFLERFTDKGLVAITFERPNQYAGHNRGFADIFKYEGIIEKFCYKNSVPFTHNITSTIYKFGTGKSQWGTRNRKKIMIKCMNEFLEGEQGESVTGDNEADALCNLLLTNYKQHYDVNTPALEPHAIEEEFSKQVSLLSGKDKKVAKKVKELLDADKRNRDSIRPIIHDFSAVFIGKYQPTILERVDRAYFDL